MKMKIMVTGGAGFIGSALCRHLVNDLGHDVVNVDIMTYAATEGSTAMLCGNPSYRFFRRDIRDRLSMQQLMISENVDGIIHLAAESHVDRSIDSPASFIEANVIGTFSLLQAAGAYHDSLPARRKEGFRFHHVSTDEVFGALPLHEGRFTESTPYSPSSPYSASKAASDHLVTAWYKTYGLPVVRTNCSNNYGPFQFPEKLIPLVILNGLEGKHLPVYGKGVNVRDWLHVEDHARALAMVFTRGRLGQSYNIGGRNERTNLAVVEAIADLLDQELPLNTGPRRALITFVEDRPGHDLRYAIDASKIENELGWRAKYSFETGLKETISWYMANQDWWQPLRAARYAAKRLGNAPS